MKICDDEPLREPISIQVSSSFDNGKVVRIMHLISSRNGKLVKSMKNRHIIIHNINLTLIL